MVSCSSQYIQLLRYIAIHDESILHQYQYPYIAYCDKAVLRYIIPSLAGIIYGPDSIHTNTHTYLHENYFKKPGACRVAGASLVLKYFNSDC